MKWIPDSSTQLKNVAKTVTEVIPCYFRYFKKIKILCAGKKPINTPENKAISKREWKSAQKKNTWKNPIKKGQKYLEYLDSNPDFKYKDVADKFKVSKARVSQMIALVKKLPKDILDNFDMEKYSEDLKVFTERKLRPLTLLESDEEKIDQFGLMVNK